MKIVVAQPQLSSPEELSLFGLSKAFRKVVKAPVKVVRKTGRWARKHKKLVIGGALLGGGLYAYKAGWLGKAAVGKTIGKSVGLKTAKTVALGHTLKKVVKGAGKIATSPLVLTTAAIATKSKICTGDKCYGIEPVYVDQPYQPYGYYPENQYTPSDYLQPYQATQYEATQTKDQKGSSHSEAGLSLSFLTNPYILGALAVGTAILLARRK